MDTYENLYKNALERAKKFIEGNPLVQNLNTWIKETFPELKESEDERIRKALIEMVHDTTGDSLWVDYNIHKEEALAWLEKQKIKKNEWFFEKGKWYVKLQHHYEGDLRHFERGHVYQALSEVKITDGYHNVSLSSWEIPKYFRPATKDEIPKQIEKQLLNEDNNIRNYFINAVKEQPNIHQDWKEKCLAWLEKQGGQKSIWHNEDEEPKRGSLILLIMQSGTPIVAKIIEPNHTFNHGERWAYIDDLLEKQGNESVNIDIESMVSSYEQRLENQGSGNLKNNPLINMCLSAFRHGVENTLEELNLKKLEKQGEQKPAWSEEDERMCQETIDWFEKKCFPYALESENPARESIKWLKSLKQRIGWKPSDEQMQCLHDAIEHYHTNGYPASKLTELYEQMLYIYKL